ncbi:DUF6879 family protein [Haloactinomyces albus]|uniref:DUF6879 domain-containing protein n=1 Tax=Haloactinomyces albus TaxID=1352928 RepID=A0AAE3ZE93_9ACTN|nr:DUF6879 family protein [Haloactinomyces albus]MDR7302236.1 hypothetical protein [Haloactinomyces albus]
MSDLVAGEDFQQLFREFTFTAFRLENQGIYREPHEAEPLRQFLAGEQPDDRWLQPWVDNVRKATSEGRQFQRVRVLTEPLTDYLRFEMDLALRQNIPAGEDIRAVSQPEAVGLGLPENTDFWMFDDERVALMHFGDHGMLGAEMLTDPDTVAQYREWCDRAWDVAVPHEQWAKLLP